MILVKLNITSISGPAEFNFNFTGSMREAWQKQNHQFIYQF